MSEGEVEIEKEGVSERRGGWVTEEGTERERGSRYKDG